MAYSIRRHLPPCVWQLLLESLHVGDICAIIDGYYPTFGHLHALTVQGDGSIIISENGNPTTIWNPVLRTLSNEPINACGPIFQAQFFNIDRIAAVALLPLNNMAACSFDNAIHILGPDGSTHLQTLVGHGDVVRCMTVLPCNAVHCGQLATGSADTTVRIWETNTGECMRTLKGHTGEILCMAVLPRGRIATGSNDTTIRIWKYAPLSGPNKYTGGLCLFVLTGHTHPVLSIVALPANRMASGSGDYTMRIWNTNTGICTCSLNYAHFGPVRALAVMPNGNLVSISDNGYVYIWDTARTNSGYTYEANINRRQATYYLCR